MFDVIIPAAGNSTRVGFDKLNENIGELTVLQRTVNAFSGIDGIEKIIVVGDAELEGTVTVKGGETRSQSVLNALNEVTAEYVLIHDGARPFVTRNLILSVMEATKKSGSAIPSLPITDTVVIKNGKKTAGLADRNNLVTVQTPQGFKTELLKKAFALAREKTEKGFVYTDESTMYSEFIEPCTLVTGDPQNKKITYAADFYGINARVGSGFDLHRFIKGKQLRLCGTDIPYEYGLLAHSDGDVALHALMDALLTAAGERDIGVLFPDTDDKYKDVNSVLLLNRVTDILKDKNLTVQSVNLVIVAQNPKLSPHIETMRNNLSAYLGISPDKIGISATTTEKVGIIGENKAIASFATVILI